MSFRTIYIYTPSSACCFGVLLLKLDVTKMYVIFFFIIIVKKKKKGIFQTSLILLLSACEKWLSTLFLVFLFFSYHGIYES